MGLAGDHWNDTMKTRWARACPPPRGDAWANFWSEWWRGPAPRAERGNVRYLVLDAIEKRPRHGYEIIQTITVKSGGGYRPSPGVVYPTLQMLEELGHVRAVTLDDRKVYEITEAGRLDLEEHIEDVIDFYDRFREVAWDLRAEEVAHVMGRVGQVIKMFKRGARRGRLRPTLVREMLVVLDDALDRLQALLAEDDDE